MITLRSKQTVALGAGLLLAALLSACGGGSSHTSTATTPTTAGNTSAAGGTGSGGGTGGGGGTGSGGSFPGASGSVAAITGSSMEVQSQQTGQTTVSWTSATTFTKTASLTAASVSAGDCVTVVGSTSTGKLVANTVMVSKPPSSGGCTAGGRFGAGGRGGAGAFRGGTTPNGGSLPRRPSGSVPSAATGFGFASGKVTSVSPSSLVIDGISSSGLGGARTGTRPSTPPTSIKTTTVTIGLQGSTTFTETESTAATSLAVGDCVTAVGSSDSTGAVTARTVRITSTGGQTCSSGFGGFGGGGAAGGGSAGVGSTNG